MIKSQAMKMLSTNLTGVPTPCVLCICIFKLHKARGRIGSVNSLLISLANKPAAAGPSTGLAQRRRCYLYGTRCFHGAL